MDPNPPAPDTCRQRPAPSERRRRALAVALLVLAGVGCVWWCVAGAQMQPWAPDRNALLALRHAQPWTFALGFFAVFALMAAVPLPGCSVLALAAGACWGFAGGALIVTLASTVGATMSFLAARHLGRDAARRRFGAPLRRVEHWIERDGALVVFWLRVAPLIPYPVLNPLLGLTGLSTMRFFVSSALGMFAGSALYAWAGAELGAAASLRDLLEPPLIAAFAVLLLAPFALREAARRFTRRALPQPSDGGGAR